MARHGVTRVRDRIRAVLNEVFFQGFQGFQGNSLNSAVFVWDP